MLSKFPCTFDLILVFLLVYGIPSVHWLKILYTVNEYSNVLYEFYQKHFGQKFLHRALLHFLPEFSVEKPQLNIFDIIQRLLKLSCLYTEYWTKLNVTKALKRNFSRLQRIFRNYLGKLCKNLNRT